MGAYEPRTSDRTRTRADRRSRTLDTRCRAIGRIADRTRTPRTPRSRRRNSSPTRRRGENPAGHPMPVLRGTRRSTWNGPSRQHRQAPHAALRGSGASVPQDPRRRSTGTAPARRCFPDPDDCRRPAGSRKLRRDGGPSRPPGAAARRPRAALPRTVLLPGAPAHPESLAGARGPSGHCRCPVEMSANCSVRMSPLGGDADGSARVGDAKRSVARGVGAAGGAGRGPRR